MKERIIEGRYRVVGEEPVRRQKRPWGRFALFLLALPVVRIWAVILLIVGLIEWWPAPDAELTGPSGEPHAESSSPTADR